jgi:hypothetical protein
VLNAHKKSSGMHSRDQQLFSQGSGKAARCSGLNIGYGFWRGQASPLSIPVFMAIDAKDRHFQRARDGDQWLVTE